MKNVRKYFDKVAYNYERLLSQPLLHRLKEKEKCCILKFLDIKKRDKVLDAGCGIGFYSKIINSLGGESLGIDISPKMVKVAKKNGIKALVVDLHSFALKQKFDKILCIGVLEFCQKPEVVIKNLNNHLKKGGDFIILFPKKSFPDYLYKLYHQFHGIKIRLFEVNEMKRMLLSNGLQIIEMKNPTSLSCVINSKKQ